MDDTSGPSQDRQRSTPVALLFSDIEGSTRLVDRLGSRFAELQSTHRRIVRKACATGSEIGTQGDSFFFVFEHPERALAAAVETQRGLASHQWPVDGVIRVRIGIHLGRPMLTDEGYVGLDVNRAARVCDAGHGGQILLSSAMYELVAGRLPDDVTLRDLGRHRLKDLRHFEHLHQVVAAGVPDVPKGPRVADPDGSGHSVVVDEEAQLRRLPDSMRSMLESVRKDGEPYAVTNEFARELAQWPAATLTEYRLSRIAEWSQPQHQLDGRFVQLTLLVDQGETSLDGRWSAQPTRHQDLGSLLRSTADPALVVLGTPGCGKTTLLRHLELETAVENLRVEDDRGTITFLVQLNQYVEPRPGALLPAPGDWLCNQWQARHPSMPPLEDLLSRGDVLMLVDALNEIPTSDDHELHDKLQLWRQWLRRFVGEMPGNRVVFTCRSLDYSQPMSTPDLRVPQVRIEPLADEKVQAFLELYCPVRGREVWEHLRDSRQLDVVRNPYFLTLLADQVSATGGLPLGRSALFTGFVRQAMRREVERANTLFEPGPMLSGRDLKRLARWTWASPWDLPERGALIPELASLAHAMQSRDTDGEPSQLRIDVDDALEVLDEAHGEAILAAGESLAVLDEDQASEQLMYVHQLVQEYFAARAMARDPSIAVESTISSWLSDQVQPTLQDLLHDLPLADELPPLPSTGWEETVVLGAAMTSNPTAFVGGLIVHNPVLAGRCANAPDVLIQLDESLIGELQGMLLAQSRDRRADIRHRIACALELGQLGDRRFVRKLGAESEYIVPRLVTIEGGEWPIGDDDTFVQYDETYDAHVPRHGVSTPPYLIAAFPVTNAEWRCFMDAGGYDDSRWWRTESSRRWLTGEGTMAPIRCELKRHWARMRNDPESLARHRDSGGWDEKTYEGWKSMVTLTEEEIDALLLDKQPDLIMREPGNWRDPRHNEPTQPVSGISWYEALAYCAWLSAQSGRSYRLPTEVEHEAAQRGMAARRWAFGDTFDPLRANTLETRLRRASPVGVFVEGDTPEGVSDLCGNVWEWTSSMFGRTGGPPAFRYPYEPCDGREALEGPMDTSRILKGGAWDEQPDFSRAANRYGEAACWQGRTFGMRLCESLTENERR